MRMKRNEIFKNLVCTWWTASTASIVAINFAISWGVDKGKMILKKGAGRHAFHTEAQILI